jgi:hypothetical protein
LHRSLSIEAPARVLNLLAETTSSLGRATAAGAAATGRPYFALIPRVLPIFGQQGLALARAIGSSSPRSAAKFFGLY